MKRLVPVERLAGDGADETALLREMHSEAVDYISSFEWCGEIVKQFFGGGIGGVVAIFLIEFAPAEDRDKVLWVVVGDLPSAYLVTDDAPTALAALGVYCELMEDWVSVVRSKRDLQDAFPVRAAPTPANADMLELRVKLLKEDVIPRMRQAQRDDSQ